MDPLSAFVASAAPLAAFMGGHWEWLILLLIILVLFGTRLPKVARSLGQGISEFKRGLGDKPLPDDQPIDAAPTPPAPPPPPPRS